jgi:hypothetical protein
MRAVQPTEPPKPKVREREVESVVEELIKVKSPGRSERRFIVGRKKEHHPEGPATGHLVTGFLGFPLSSSKC